MTSSYDLLGYKRLIVDYHFSDFVSDTLAHASASDYVRACRELGVDSVLVYAKDHWGNCYFQTSRFPRHANVPQDLFGEILDGLRENDMVGYAYFSVGWDEHLAHQHPQWIMRTADGRQIRRGAPDHDRTTGRWRYLCLNSPARDYLLDQIAELVAQYDFPALFLDILFLNLAGQVCSCDACRGRWRAEHGGPLPTSWTPEYLDFAIGTVERFYRDVKGVLAASNKSILTTHNFGLPYELDDYVAFEFNALGRNFLRGSAIAKIMRAQAAGREVELIGHRFNQDWDFTTKPIALMRWEAATVLAHNCALMWVDQPHMDGSFDAAALAAMKASYEVVDEIKPHVRGSKPHAEIALLYPERSARLDPDQELDFVGAYKLLSELHWPFDVVVEDQLSASALAQYQAVIAPYASHLRPQTVAAVRAYVEHGGDLLFTYKTAIAGLGDELQEQAFGMIQFLAENPHPASFLLPEAGIETGNTYLRVTDAVRFRPTSPTETLATVVDPNIDVNRDRWVSHNVAPGKRTGQPAVVSGAFGDGRFIYCGPRLFAEIIRQGLPALSEFSTALLRRLVEPTMWVEAPKPVEVTFNRRGDELVVVLVNGLTNRPVRGGVIMLRDAPSHDSLDEVIPLSDVRLYIRNRVVLGAEDRHGRSLVIQHDPDANTARVALESLQQYEVIHVDIAAP